MPNTKSAKKELRKNIKRKAINNKLKNNLKSLIKKTRKAIVAKDAKASELFTQAIKAFDKAAKKGLIKKNTSSRNKSRLHKKLNQSLKI